MSGTPGTPETIGRYRIVTQVASDALSQVYSGFDPMIERPVVVKVFQIATADPARNRIGEKMRARDQRRVAGRKQRPFQIQMGEQSGMRNHDHLRLFGIRPGGPRLRVVIVGVAANA
jgi:hypothetical protein